MVQWLKPCTSNTVGTGSILGQGTKIPWVTCAKKEKKRQSSVNLGSDSLAAQRELGSCWRPDPSCPAGAQHVCVWPPAQTSPPPTPTDSCPVLSSSAHSLQGVGDWERPQVPGGHLEGTGRAAGSEGALDNTLLPGRGSWGEGHGRWPGLGEGGPGGEWGSTLGADAGAELLKADVADSGQTDPVRAASRRVAVVTGEGTIAARRERLVAPGAGGVRHQEM